MKKRLIRRFGSTVVFVLSNKVFDYLSNKDSMLEDQLMKKLVSENQIKTFKHHGFGNV